MLNYWLEIIRAEEAYKELTEKKTSKTRGIRLETSNGHIVEMKDTIADSYIDDIPEYIPEMPSIDFNINLDDIPTEIKIEFPPIVFSCTDLTQDHM